MKKLTWRLSKLPTPDELQGLVKDKIITQEEAREILFRSEDDTERDSESFKSEIKFLRDLVEKLSSTSRSTVIEYIYSRPYDYGWYKPYVTWCGSVQNLMTPVTAGLSSNTITTGYCAADLSNLTMTSTDNQLYCMNGTGGISASGSNSFSDISTF